jgi:glycosyltransferase involved in cell wall biosynthesis
VNPASNQNESRTAPYRVKQESESGYRTPVLPVPEGTRRPLWSVMIPTYNCAKYLRETLASVLAQDPGAEHMQIEVVDDCSTKDDPQAVVREMGMGRVVFYRQPTNVGHTRNFETCLQRSRGYLTHLLHGDDAVRPGFYAKMETIFEGHPEIGAAFSRNMFIDEHGNWIGVTPLELSHSGIIVDLIERLAVRQRIQTPAMVVRREVYETLGAFDRRLSWTEDWEMWARIATRYPVWYEAEPLALYRMHASSNTGRYTLTGENVDDMGRLFSILKEYVPNGAGRTLTRQGRDLYARKALEGAAGMAANGNFSGVIAQARAAVHLSCTPAIVWPLFRLASQSLFYGMRRLRSRSGLRRSRS